jgi:hypothetical protein
MRLNRLMLRIPLTHSMPKRSVQHLPMWYHLRLPEKLRQVELVSELAPVPVQAA